MKELILCKYGEIALKGLNKSSFESTLCKNVKYEFLLLCRNPTIKQCKVKKSY